VDGRDISAAPLDIDDDVHGVTIAFTDHPPTLMGTVRDSRGFADPSALVAVFPADDRDALDAGVSLRRIRGVRTPNTGVYTIAGLPPGDYYLVAMSDAISQAWQEPDRLRALKTIATRVTLRANDSKIQDLTIVKSMRWR
ncbi:MAG: carboxypeptidase-like regulatory domain-containing protein, partial [Gemmatimonadaceae bacterium]